MSQASCPILWKQRRSLIKLQPMCTISTLAYKYTTTTTTTTTNSNSNNNNNTYTYNYDYNNYTAAAPADRIAADVYYFNVDMY